MPKPQRTCEWCARYDPSYPPCTILIIHASSYSIPHTPFILYSIITCIILFTTQGECTQENDSSSWRKLVQFCVAYPVPSRRCRSTGGVIAGPNAHSQRAALPPASSAASSPPCSASKIPPLHCPPCHPRQSRRRSRGLSRAAALVRGAAQTWSRWMGMWCLPPSTCWFGAAAARENGGDGTGWRW
jgi:hypothetical protein